MEAEMVPRNSRFFSICPRNTQIQNYIVEGIPLRVVRSDGVEVNPDIKFNKIRLAGNDTIFRNQSGEQDSFSITVMLHEKDSVNGHIDASSATKNTTTKATGSVIKDYMSVLNNLMQGMSVPDTRTINLLDSLIRNAEPFYVVTNAVGISQDELWLVTEQKKRKQSYDDGYVKWDLTFTRYKEVTIGKFNKSTDVITKALEKKKSSSSSKNTDSKTKLRNKLKKCDYKVLVYSEKKKTVNCVKVMQELLYLEGCYPKNTTKKTAVDGWYGKSTRSAVKNYKNKYREKYGIGTKTGKSVDKKTWKVMCGTAEKVVVTVQQSKTNITTSNLDSAVKQATSKDSTYGTIVNVNVSSDNVKNATVSVKSKNLKSTKDATKTKTVKTKSGFAVDNQVATKKNSKSGKGSSKGKDKKNSNKSTTSKK